MYQGMWLYLQMVSSWFEEFNDEQKTILMLQLLVCSMLFLSAYLLSILIVKCALKLKASAQSNLAISHIASLLPLVAANAFVHCMYCAGTFARSGRRTVRNARMQL